MDIEDKLSPESIGRLQPDAKIRTGLNLKVWLPMLSLALFVVLVGARL